MSSPAIIYHYDCHDGITALWAGMKKFPDAEAMPGIHGEMPDFDKLKGRDVYLVDFSYKYAVLKQIANVANEVVILDHHKTAEQDLRGIQDKIPNVFCVFDMDRSGAGIAWDYFHPEKKRPGLIDYVEDRDLWRFNLPFSKEIHAACGLEPLTLEARNKLIEEFDVDSYARRGATALKYHRQLVDSAVRGAWTSTVAGHDDIPTIGNPVIAIMSDLLYEMAQGQPFAMGFYYRDGKRIYSLRSADDGLDVGEIARSMGGGGHKHAAGFEVDL